APDAALPKGDRLAPGTPVEVLEQRPDGWAQVRRQDGWTVWIDGRRLFPLAVAPPPPPPAAPPPPPPPPPSVLTAPTAVTTWPPTQMDARGTESVRQRSTSKFAVPVPGGVGLTLILLGSFLPWFTAG